MTSLLPNVSRYHHLPEALLLYYTQGELTLTSKHPPDKLSVSVYGPANIAFKTAFPEKTAPGIFPLWGQSFSN